MQPVQEKPDMRLRLLFLENGDLRNRLSKCQWYLEAVGEAISLEVAKELAGEGLIKSLGQENQSILHSVSCECGEDAILVTAWQPPGRDGRHLKPYCLQCGCWRSEGF